MSSGTDEGPIGPAALPLVGPTERAAVGPGVQGGYWVVRELGSGAFGTVYRAEEKATGDRVAIRLLPDGLAGTPHAVEAVQRTPVSVSKTSAPAAATRVAPAAGPASPAVEPSATVNSSAESRDYWIQVGAFKDPDAAKQLAVRLRKQDYRVEESSRSGYGDVLHRVRVGPYADRTTAAAALKALVGKGYKPFIAKR